MPMTPFMGVRISWLIVARNSDLRREASSAWSYSRAVLNGRRHLVADGDQQIHIALGKIAFCGQVHGGHGAEQAFLIGQWHHNDTTNLGPGTTLPHRL